MNSMKALVCKTCAVFAATLLLGFTGQAQELKKDFHEEYSANSSTVLNIESAFGEVNLTNGNQNQVVIDVVVTAKHKNQEKAQKLLDMITITIKKEGNEIIVKGDLDNKLTKDEGEEKKEFSIDITVVAPKSIGLEMDHAFGDIDIAEVDGSVSLDIAYGDLKAMALLGDGNIDLAYGNATFGQLGDKVTLHAAYNELVIKKAGNLHVDIAYGSLNVGSVKNLYLDAAYTDVEIKSVDRDFENLNMEVASSDITVDIESGAGFKFKGEVVMGDFNLPKMESVVESKAKMAHSLQGVYGNGRSQITVDGAMSDITIRVK